ncbi:MAG: hypothetical protein NUV47_01090 [Patescibacteria group bacterium]|nr:hypothetical protein [Patescibacteria group bacterium]
MKNPELIVSCLYGYYTKSKLFAYVAADPPSTTVRGTSVAEVKSKLKNRIKKLKLPYELKFQWILA